jgi:hypothetical protein
MLCQNKANGSMMHLDAYKISKITKIFYDEFTLKLMMPKWFYDTSTSTALEQPAVALSW